jgi:formylglycine-generating enzyme required for sulfatase activity
LNLTIAVTDVAGSRTYASEQFPLSIGSNEDAAIRLPEGGPDIPVAFLGYSGERFFVQPGSASQAATLQGRPLTESRWLEGGEVLQVAGCAVRFAVEASGLRVTVEPDSGENVTVPPVVEVAPRSGPAPEIDDEEIRPLEYRRDGSGVALRPGRKFPVAGAVVTAAIVILAVAAWFMFTARSVEILVSPEPEFVAVDGGLVFKFGPRYLIRPGEYRVLAELEEYEPLNATIEVTGQRAQSIQLSMARLPDRLFLETPNVAGAEVLVDGESVGTTPLEDYPLRAGRYRVEVRADRFVGYAEDLDVAGGGSAIRKEISLVPDWAPVNIDSEPPGGTVLVDGQEMGATPLEMELRSGRHELEVRRSGFKTWRQTVDVEPDTPLDLPTIEMRPSDGTLVVRSTPDGATVLVDGEFRGRSPVRLELDPGRNYRVELSQAGYKSASRNIRLRSGQSRTENFRLEAVTGIVNLSVAPADVELLVDDKPAGPAPDRLELIALPHRLEFRKPGHVSRTVTVKPTPGIPQRLEIKLLTEEEAALAAIPKTITTAQGSELILVPAGQFTMGAPRGEPGRRANEGLREVKISRPFYVGVREVTNREFREFRRAHTSGTAIGFGLDTDDAPVARVTWQDAAAYCNWLSNQDALPPAYAEESGRLVAVWPPSTGYRLPTEAEWAWASRYSGRDRAPTRYPWGDTMPPTPGSGNFADMSARAGLQQVLTSYNDDYPVTAPVGRFRPNALGLFDAGGNVSEWTNDLYRAYGGVNQSLMVDPNGAEEGRYYVIRGSSWRHGSISELRWTWRDSADEPRPDLGFRIVRSIN